MWENFLYNPNGNAGWGTALLGAGAAIYGGMQQAKMVDLAKKEHQLAQDSYYRNVLRQDKEDKAIDDAAGAIKI